MGCEKSTLCKNFNVKKLKTIYITFILMATSIISIFPLIVSEGTNDSIITYANDGGLSQQNNFCDGHVVLVNYSSNNMTGDPVSGTYNLNVTNLNTSEWIYVSVRDNDTSVPLDSNNDGNYWGRFNLSSTEGTRNSTGHNDLAAMNGTPGNIINISEIDSPYPLDNDSDIAFHHILFNESSSSEHNSSHLVIQGYVNDTDENPLANVTVMYMQHGENEICNQTVTNATTGFYEFNFTMFGEEALGHGELEVILDGYVPYFNWDVSLEENGIYWLNITLTPYFNDTKHILGNVTDNSSGIGINATEIILLDTDFTHMMMDGKEDYLSNETGFFNISVNYSGTFNLIAFKDGYYASMTPVLVDTNDNGETIFQNISLHQSPPDNQQMTLQFTDLDDITVTVNRTIIAESRMVRFLLDSMNGDGNQNVSQDEVGSYMEELNIYGPTVNVTLDDEPQNEEGPPDFLSIPINLLLDYSNLDVFEPGTLDATMENIVNTSVTSDDIIYFNATFQLTLDGSILNQLLHNFTVSSEYAVLINNTINISFAEFYNVNQTAQNTNMSVYNSASWVNIQPGNGTLNELAYAWIDLDLNQSTVTLPITDTPTWHVTDEWNFNKTTNQGIQERGYRVQGKPSQSWDREQYMIPHGESSLRYLCYEVRNEGGGFETMKFPTINNLDWIELDEEWMNIDYIVNDLDFPLYSNKEWETSSWWGENVTASVIEMDVNKTTAQGKIEHVILVNFTNITDEVVAQQWYAPSVKFFVNRTQFNPDGSINSSWNLTSYSFGAFIQSISSAYQYDLDSDSEYDGIQVNVTLNTSGLNQNRDYLLEGSLFKESHIMEPPTEITWISRELFNLDNSVNERTYSINYSGGLIYGKEVNGPYTGWLELFEWENGGPTTNLDYVEFETTAYNYTSFEKPAVIATNITDFGNDTNNNSLYDSLTLNVTINVTQPGNYSINSGLEYVIDRGFWEDWWWITGTGSGKIEFTSTGNFTIPLNFDGREIYDQAFSGNYRYHLEIMNEDTWVRVFEKNGRLAHTYNYSDFETPSIYFNKSYMNQDGIHDYITGSDLIINTSIFVGEDALGDNNNFEIHGGLHYIIENNTDEWGEFITGNGEDINLYEGTNPVQLTFDASEIRQKLQEDNVQGNISFKVGLGFCERIGDWYGEDIDNTDYFTQNYTLDDFPEPGIILNISNSTITEDGDWLRITANITLNDVNYTGDYELHGGIHWVDNSSGDNDWWWITGNGEPIQLPDTGSYQIQMNFSGMEVASSGHDGPYAIWMGLESMPDWIEVANDEFYTPSYNTTDFIQPSVIIDSDNITEEINGTDYFTITVPINVAEAGEYGVHSGIHWIDYSQGWDDWRFITGTGDEQQFSTGEHIITLNFEQGMIKNELENQDYSGKLMLHIGVENISTWTPIANTEYETNQPYCADDFSSSGVNIIDHFFEIEDGDLVLNVTVSASQNGTYAVNGGLHWIEQMDHWDNWVFITGIYQETVEFFNGTNQKEFTFNGGEIFNSMQNGPYMVWFGIENQSVQPPRILAEDEFETDPYGYLEFASAAPGVRIIRQNMTSGTVDYMNSSQNGTFLTVNVSINKSTNGSENYWLDGGLEYVNENTGVWDFISGTGDQISLSKGLNIKSLNFNAGDIYSSGYDGPYTVWISLRNSTTWNDVDNYEYTTQAYTAAEAPPPPLSFSMENGNANYSYINDEFLTINVTINVTSEAYAGEYDIHGGLHYWNGQWWEHITGTGNWVELENGTNIETLNFNAGEINQTLTEFCNNNPESDYNSEGYPLAIFMGINEIGDWNEITRCDYETQDFTKNDFPGPSVTMETTGYYINESYFTVNVTVDVSNESQYDIHGGIHWIDYSQGWDDWRFITGTGHDYQLHNGTNNISLNFNGGEIHTALQENGDSKLTVWLGLQQMDSWDELAHAELETSETYSYTYFPGPGVLLNVTGDYINQSGQFLTVNATITATENYQNRTLDLHGGIHWKEGWEWRFITGFSQQINLTQSTTNISINFNGGAIRSSEHDGPYEVWLGINEQETWEDITHRDHTTNAYDYTSFAPPNIRIVEQECSDFANGTQFITVNVTLDVNETGDYFLEGELFWKEGYHWQWITWNGEQITISNTGIQNYSLNFDATELHGAEDEGWNNEQLFAWIAVMNSSSWTEINRIDEYQLQGNYSPDDFITNPVSFNGSITEYPTNTSGGSEPYNIFNISIPLNVSIPATYEISAALFDPINNSLITKTNCTISNVVTAVNVSFNGTKISKKQYNGSFEFRAKIFNATTMKEYDTHVEMTSEYQYDEFTEAVPEAKLVNNYSSYINSNGNLVVNVTVNVSSTGNDKEFGIYGELFSNQTNTYITYNETIISLNRGENTTTLIFNGSAINNSNLNGPYLMNYIRLSVNLTGTWEEIEAFKGVHITDEYSFDQFGG